MYRKMELLGCALVCTTVAFHAAAVPAQETAAPADTKYEYKLVSTTKTSKLQEEMSTLALAGFRFEAVVGGGTTFGGSEAVVVMSRPKTGLIPKRFTYLLLASLKTSTLQQELQDAANQGYEFKGQTVVGSTLLGKEVAIILERDALTSVSRWEYRLLATKRTATMQKELSELADLGYEFVGATVSGAALAGGEVVTITRRRLK